MSIKLCTQIWALDLEPIDKLLLLALADYAQDDGTEIYPGYDSLAQKASLSKRTLIIKIQQYENCKILTRKAVTVGRGNRQEFTLSLELIGEPASPIKSLLKGEAERRKGEAGAIKGESDGKEKVNLTVRKGESDGNAYRKNRPEPSLEPSGNQERENTRASSRVQEDSLSLGKPEPHPLPDMLRGLAWLCDVSLEFLTPKQSQEFSIHAQDLIALKINPEQFPKFKKWFAENDWRGQKGERVTPSLLRTLWKSFSETHQPKSDLFYNPREVQV